MKEDYQGQDSQQFYQELEQEELAHFNKHMRGRKRTKGNASQTSNMYKEALLDSIFGRFQEASRKLKLMISLAPDSPEPYHLLGNMHQEMGQHDKAAEYLFMSTYLSPPNIQKWVKVGQLSFERNMFSQAAYCFGRALKLSSSDPTLMSRRAQAFQKAGEFRKAIATYRRLLKISSSVQFVKQYAKLRYRRGQYALCRATLEQQADFLKDSSLVHMACQTYLKQKQFQKTAQLLISHLKLKQEEISDQAQLPVEFILTLLICSAALGRSIYDFGCEQLLAQAQECYNQQYADQYSQTVAQLNAISPLLGFKMINFLLSFSPHQTVANYVIVSDYLCQQKQTQKCLQILQQGLAKHPDSPQLAAQQSYISKFLGIRHSKPQPQFEEDHIFYSDQSYSQAQQEVKNHRVQPMTEDDNILAKLLFNVKQSLEIQLKDMQQGAEQSQKDVIQSLEWLISLSPYTQDKKPQNGRLFLSKTKRRLNRQGKKKGSILYKHLPIMLSFFELLVQYLLILLQRKQYRKVLQIGERVSKVHVFKNQTTRQDFTMLKIKIYEMSALACLAVRKFNSGLFFLRYLTCKHPEDSLYLLALHLLLRIGGKRTFLSSALSKRLEHRSGHHLARLLALEYMDTGCFQLAISSFLHLGKHQPLNATSLLAISTCLIQIASSRNTFNKLDFTNRSAMCLAAYQQAAGHTPETIFNRGRWYAQVKLNHKAIACFEEILSLQCENQLKKRAAYCLLCIYKECQQFQKCEEISKKYFPFRPRPKTQQNVQC